LNTVLMGEGTDGLGFVDGATAGVVRRSASAPTEHATFSSDRKPSEAASVISRDSPHAARPPRTPPSVEPLAMRATAAFARCGSKRSLMSDQNVERMTGPSTAIAR
jgi:hypothetical protein